MANLIHNFQKITPVGTSTTLREGLENVDFSETWWIFAGRGLAQLLFGIVLLGIPDKSVIVASTVFIALLGAEGFLSLVAGIKYSAVGSIIMGFVSLALLLFVVITPLSQGIPLVFFVAFWAVISGLVSLIYSISWNMGAFSRIFSGLLGVSYVLFGIYLSLYPLEGILILSRSLGVFALIGGVLQIVYGISVKLAIVPVSKTGYV